MDTNQETGKNSRTFIVSFEGFSIYYLADRHEIVSLVESGTLDSCGPDTPISRSAQNN